MNDAPPTAVSPAVAPAHESARARLLRATTAMAVIVVIVLLLALAALVEGRRAERLQDVALGQQRRAEVAEAGALAELWKSLLAEARATRAGTRLDRRALALATLRRAAAIAPATELRNEAVATMALPAWNLEGAFDLDGNVRCRDFHPDLHRAALGMADGDVVLRRMQDGAETGRFRRAAAGIPEEQGHPVSVEFSPDGRMACVRYSGGALAAWDVEAGRAVFVRDADRARRPASRGLFTDDGRRVVAPVFEPDGFAVLEAATGRVVAHFPEVGSFHHAAVRPGHTQFAGYDGTKVLLIDWAARKVLRELPFDFGVYRLAWSPDGRHLAVLGNSLDIPLHDMVTGEVLRLRGHRDTVYEAQFDPEGGRMAALSHDGSTRIWSLADGRMLDVSTERRLNRWGAGGRMGWVVRSRRLEVWSESSGPGYSRRRGPDGGVDPEHFDVSPDGRWAVAAAAGGRGLVSWRLDPPGPPEFLPSEGVQSVVFDTRSRQLMVTRDGVLEFRDWSEAGEGGAPRFQVGPRQASMPVGNQKVDRMTCSADGRVRAFVHVRGGGIWVQRAADPEAVVMMRDVLHSSVTFQGNSPRGSGAIALSPDGRWLACGADGVRGVRVFDTRTGEALKRLESTARGVQFSPDGRWLVLTGPPDCVVFRTSDWGEAWRRPLDAYVHHAVGSTAFSPDGERLAYAAAPGWVNLVESATGRLLVRLEAPGGSPAVSVRWPAEGDRLAVVTRDHGVDVWSPGLLRAGLAGMGLDWDLRAEGPAGPPSPQALHGPSTAKWLALGIAVTVLGVGAVAVGSLRRHRRLVGEFVQAETLASRHAQELAVEREVGRLKSQFVSMVSHEFRTPLGITMGAVELLQHYSDRLPPGKRDSLLADIHGSTRHMSDLMEQVLLLGRVEADRLGFNPEPLDLVALLERLASEVRRASGARCPVRVECPSPLDGALADEALVRHIVGNLVSNAVKYSPPGALVVVRAERSGNEVVVVVVDRGIGIPPAEQPRLFQAFHRAGNVGRIPGSGLGLVIVKRCAELHGGSVAVRSNPGEGSEFTVRLPVFGAAPAPPPAA